MISNYVVLTVPQWAIFTAISAMVYGWVEKKRIFGIVGSGILSVLGVYAAYTLFTGLMVPESMFDTSSYLPKEELFNPDELPLEGRLLPIYWGLVINGFLAIFTMITEIRGNRLSGILKSITGGIAILLFFIMMAVVGM
jgi:hypothetical protein